MDHVWIEMECGCKTVWWEADTCPGVGGYAECQEHGTQEITSAEKCDDYSASSRMLGQRGGSKTSEAKRAASRANGRRGGRPRSE